jgi:hypothetical protein
VLRDKSDYMQEFYHIVTKSKHKERNGKFQGFIVGGRCVGNDRFKMRPLRKFYKQQGEIRKIVGIAIDEPERLARLKENDFSILAKYKITEDMTYDICKKYNLLSPTYSNKTRGGCWFCPNQPIKEFALLKKNYPYLWEELREFSKCDNICSKKFKYNMTFEQVEKEVDFINSQLTLFDFMESENEKQGN